MQNGRVTRAQRLHHLARRRPGPLGTLLLPLTWVLLGLAIVAYVVLVMLLAFAAVLVATLRLVLTPVLRQVLRLPGLGGLRDRRRMRTYARGGVAEHAEAAAVAPVGVPVRRVARAGGS